MSGPDQEQFEQRHWQATLASLTGICARPDSKTANYDEICAEALDQADWLMNQYHCPGEQHFRGIYE